MEISGNVKYGNGFLGKRDTVLTGDANIQGGNWAYARFITNGFALDWDITMPEGVYIDGAKQDSATREIKEPLPVTAKIQEALAKGGEDAESAYEKAVDLIHADMGGYDLSGFLVDYDASLGADNFTYAKSLFKKLAIEVQGQAWVDSRTNEQIFAAMQTFMLGKTKDQLMGVATEVVEVIS